MEGFIKELKSVYFQIGGGGGSNPFQIFFKREILKSVYNGLIHPENKL